MPMLMTAIANRRATRNYMVQGWLRNDRNGCPEGNIFLNNIYYANMDYTNGRSEVFIDRKDELGFLRGVLDRKGFQLIPVWGRRRVGKTTLLRKALGEHAVNFIASDSQERDNLLQFRKTCAECLNDPTFNDLEPNCMSCSGD
jgi:hypothetical protein